MCFLLCGGREMCINHLYTPKPGCPLKDCFRREVNEPFSRVDKLWSFQLWYWKIRSLKLVTSVSRLRTTGRLRDEATARRMWIRQNEGLPGRCHALCMSVHRDWTWSPGPCCRQGTPRSVCCFAWRGAGPLRVQRGGGSPYLYLLRGVGERERVEAAGGEA